MIRNNFFKPINYKQVCGYFLMFILLFIAIYLIIRAVKCQQAVNDSKQRLATYEANTIALSYGEMTYVDKGEGKTILSIHGIFGGYDQAYDTAAKFSTDYRVIAPSRFGYLGSDVLGQGTPAEQAQAYIELLDKLGIDKVYLLATSAGGTTAIRFALDYPNRIQGIILYSAAMPYVTKPESYPQYAGPPAVLCHNFTMFLLSPWFEPIMGMEPDTIYSMLPVEDRKEGIILDASVTNLDMARHFDQYPIESLSVPILIFHAKDDKLVSYESVKKVLNRFPNKTLIAFETGGHLLVGHSSEIETAVSRFIDD